MSFLKKLKSKKDNDQGSALVLVIIAVAFVGTLVAMLVYLVYFNYLMKFTDRVAKNNFYTAETALDVIHAGLEKDVSMAMSTAYYNVMQDHMNDDATTKQAAFETEFVDALKALDFGAAPTKFMRTQGTGVGSETVWVYEPSYLENYWITGVKNSNNLSANLDGFKIYNATTNYGAKMETLAASGTNYGIGYDPSNVKSNLRNEGPLVEFVGSVINFYNVKVSYTNQDGYISIMETDIQIETPKINFANNLNMPKLEQYSMVAAKGIYDGYERTDEGEPVMNPALGTEVEVTGNVFGGEEGIYSYGISSCIDFKKKDTDAISTIRYLTSDSINAIQGRAQNDDSGPASSPNINVESVYEVYAGDLYAESATMNIESNCYIQDDLTTDGIYPKVTIGNTTGGGSKYIGFGANPLSATNSSAILINGAKSTVDLSKVKELRLADHAYVGARHYNANAGETDEVNGDYIKDIDKYLEEIDKKNSDLAEQYNGENNIPNDKKTLDKNSNDVLMGQSMAVKSDQIMYMVPVECMCYEGSTQVLAKNPLTYTEYKKFAETYEPLTDSAGNVQKDTNGNVIYSQNKKYDIVRLDVIMKNAEGSLSTYNATIVPVFRRINGDILVYYYMSFANGDYANKFFKDYYTKNPNSFIKYFNSYILSFKLSDTVRAGGEALSMGGNMLYMFPDNTIRIISDTNDSDLISGRNDVYQAQSETLQKQYIGLYKYLLASTEDLTAEQVTNNAFQNVTVPEADFNAIVSEGAFRRFTVNEAALDGFGNPITDAEGNPVVNEVTKAIVVNNKNQGAFVFGASNAGLDSATLPTTRLIIASGDVVIDVEEFTGLILCGGNIYIGKNCKKINYDNSAVPQAMIAKNTDSNRFAFEVIRNGVAYANAAGASDPSIDAAIDAQAEADIIRAASLVRFVNWNKE